MKGLLSIDNKEMIVERCAFNCSENIVFCDGALRRYAMSIWHECDSCKKRECSQERKLTLGSEVFRHCSLLYQKSFVSIGPRIRSDQIILGDSNKILITSISSPIILVVKSRHLSTSKNKPCSSE
jgi:hypothetical protein